MRATNHLIIQSRDYFQHFKDIPAIEKVIMVNPSSRAAAIEVHCTKPGGEKGIKLSNEDELSCVAGETITGLSTSFI
jgi:hypothetical protein